MSEAINEKISFADEVVGEYQIKQKEVMKNFVYWCVELWEILSKYREALKKENKWVYFLETVNLHITTANQQIRLYEISKEKIAKDVLASTITNREKLHLFLALNDEQKEKVLEKKFDENTTTADFRAGIAEIKDTDVTIPDNDFEEANWKKMTEAVGGNPLLVDTKKTSRLMQEDIKMSVKVRELVEWVLFIEKAKEVLKHKLDLTDSEKEQMRDLYANQIWELETAYSEFFS